MVCVIRMIGHDNRLTGLIISIFVAFYSHHVYNMAMIKFDYGYNMKVNVIVGVLNGAMWLVWSFQHYSDGPHVR